MTIWVYSGNRPSNGAKELAKLPGFKRCRTGKFVKEKDVFVNWGTTNLQGLNAGMVLGTYFLNTNDAVKRAADKLKTFKALVDIQTVPWTTEQSVVEEWSEQGATIVGRQTLTGHSGDGIIIIDKGEPIQPAKLYTKYIFKEKEYRVHVVGVKVIDTQRKIRDPGREPTSWKVRSHANGFIFARNGIDPDNDRNSLAVAAIQSLGLDFGAVDIIQDKHGKYYVLEVNTAPGLEGQTIQLYGNAFRAIDGN